MVVRDRVGLGEHVDGVRLVVVPAFVISGRTVVKGRPAEPIANARVLANGLGRGITHPSARSQVDGTFELEGLAPGPYLLGVFGEDVSLRLSNLGSPRLDVIDRDITGVVIELELGVRVTGKVDPPMEVFIQPSCRSRSFESDRKTGAFIAEHLPIGACRLGAESSDGWKGETSIIVGERGEQDVMIKLVRKPAIQGRVVSSDGTPVAKAEVQAGDRGHETRADGRFRIEVSEHKAYRVVASYRDDRTVSVVNGDCFPS